MNSNGWSREQRAEVANYLETQAERLVTADLDKTVAEIVRDLTREANNLREANLIAPGTTFTNYDGKEGGEATATEATPSDNEGGMTLRSGTDG
jgi:hypothetical protein